MKIERDHDDQNDELIHLRIGIVDKDKAEEIEDEQRKDKDLSKDQISLGIGLKDQKVAEVEEKVEAKEEMIKKT
jgi:hypothetical protein